MNREKLQHFSYVDLKNIAQDMGLMIRRSKDGMIEDILLGFKEYEKYKKDKIDKYTRGRQLGEKGKEGTTYLVTSKGKEYAQKTFRKHKSSTMLRKEADLQKRAADLDIAPNIIDIDTVSKYIVMDKMDRHLLDIMISQNGDLTKDQQKQIVFIFKKLDRCGVFHADPNLLNFMYKDDKLYIIDFGMAKEITTSLSIKLGTDKPNMNIMIIGFILQLKERKCPASSYHYLSKYLSEEQKLFYKI